MSYNFTDIEKKWQDYWDQHQIYKTVEDPAKKKLYVLDMFPYPSGAGLHVGHPEGYTATDIFTRFQRLNGVNVLHPMGWDAFGLPAERYAMQTNIHPSVTTEQNINNFRRQIKMLGLSYDWEREINTTDPNYYKWTQWIFLKMYNSWYDFRTKKARPIETLIDELEKFGTNNLLYEDKFSSDKWKNKSDQVRQDFLAQFRLAYIAEIPVNWCEALGTVLANEEVDDWVEKGYSVERRPMKQWMMRITAYCQRLLEDAATLDWPASTVEMQKNWIGRSEGAEVDFAIANSSEKIRIFTTRPDTIFGATYLVLAPEHPLVDSVTISEKKIEVNEYRKQASFKSERDRGMDNDKSGVFTGGYAINPANGKQIPIWISDYVLMGYGFGAIMSVPAHDERDWEFAKKYSLPIVEVIKSLHNVNEKVFVAKEEPCVNSSNSEVSIDGLVYEQAFIKIVSWFESKGIGKKKINFKLRDWLFSRQRYWGEPIPIIHWEDGTMSALDEKELPLVLPNLEKFQPSGTTESPLALASDWVNVVDTKTEKKGRRETNTMPQWGGSCWYYLRYIDPKNDTIFCDLEKQKYWMPIDLYVGGSEHAVLHLMYARFWHKVLFDLGYVTTHEPFIKLRHQGIILGENSKKMSKSLGNVVNPDDVVKEYGADALRLFEMFMGPLEEMKPWSTKGVEGVFRFLNRVWRLYITDDEKLNEIITDVEPTAEFLRVFHQTVKKVTEDIPALRFNTAIAQMMIFMNEAYKQEKLPKKLMQDFLIVLAPFAPHITEELWKRLGNSNSIFKTAEWVKYDSSKIEKDDVSYVAMVNGKKRATFNVPKGTDLSTIPKIAKQFKTVEEQLKWSIEKSPIVKEGFINFVASPIQNDLTANLKSITKAFELTANSLSNQINSIVRGSNDLTSGTTAQLSSITQNYSNQLSSLSNQLSTFVKSNTLLSSSLSSQLNSIAQNYNNQIYGLTNQLSNVINSNDVMRSGISTQLNSIAQSYNTQLPVLTTQITEVANLYQPLRNSIVGKWGEQISERFSTISEEFMKNYDSYSNSRYGIISSGISLGNVSGLSEIVSKNYDSLINISKHTVQNYEKISAYLTSSSTIHDSWIKEDNTGVRVINDMVYRDINFATGFAADISKLSQVVISTLDLNNSYLSNPILSGDLRNFSTVVNEFTSSYGKLNESLFNDKFNVLKLHKDIVPLSSVEYFNNALTLGTINSGNKEIEQDTLKTKKLIKEDTESVLEKLLNNINPNFLRMWQGAIEAKKSSNPDKVRHYSISLRELFRSVLDEIAPEKEVMVWNTRPQLLQNNKPTRKAKILYVCRNINVESFNEFIEKDADTVIELFNILNKAAHSADFHLTEDQIEAIKLRFESTIRLLLELATKA